MLSFASDSDLKLFLTKKSTPRWQRECPFCGAPFWKPESHGKSFYTLAFLRGCSLHFGSHIRAGSLNECVVWFLCLTKQGYGHDSVATPQALSFWLQSQKGKVCLHREQIRGEEAFDPLFKVTTGSQPQGSIINQGEALSRDPILRSAVIFQARDVPAPHMRTNLSGHHGAAL